MKTSRIITTLALAAGLSVPFAAAASAAPTTTRVDRTVDLETVRTRCEQAIDNRFGQLDRLSNQVNAAVHVSQAQKDALQASISATRTGLTSLRATIAADTERETLVADCKRIVTDYRVYVLVSPQVHLLIGADAAQSGVDALNAAVPKAEAAIAAAKAQGEDTSAAEALLADLKTQTAAADALSHGVIASVTPLTPADYNNGTARPVLEQARADLARAGQDLKQAGSDARQLINDLKS
jgi:hypothetical protein